MGPMGATDTAARGIFPVDVTISGSDEVFSAANGSSDRNKMPRLSDTDIFVAKYRIATLWIGRKPIPSAGIVSGTATILRKSDGSLVF